MVWIAGLSSALVPRFLRWSRFPCRHRPPPALNRGRDDWRNDNASAVGDAHHDELGGAAPPIPEDLNAIVEQLKKLARRDIVLCHFHLVHFVDFKFGDVY